MPATKLSVHMKRPRTPEELARERKRDKFDLYLNVENVEWLRSRGAKYDISLSQLVDEAIANYVNTLKKQKR